MRYLGWLMLLILVGCASQSAEARPRPKPAPLATFTWDRMPNAIDYRFYLCWIPRCTPDVPRTEIVAQTIEGVTPTFRIDLTGSVGAAAVSARNASGESGLSNVVRFDRR
jgi:hypothetical protein